MDAKLYRVGDIAKELKIKTARAAYLMKTLIEQGEVVPVIQTCNAKFYDAAALEKARALNKETK